MTRVYFSKPISVLILYFKGIHEDDEDTLQSVKGLEESVTRLGHPVRSIAVHAKNWQKAVRQPGDVVFNLVEDASWTLYM